MTKYMVFVNVFNRNANESVTYEVTFNSMKEVRKYIKSLSCDRDCSGHVEKWTKGPNDEYFTSDLVMNF